MRQALQKQSVELSQKKISDYLLIMVVVTGCFLVISIFSLLLYQIYFFNRVHPGVRIANVDAGQMTYSQVEQLVAQQATDLLNRPISLISSKGSFTLTAAELGAQVDIAKTVELAFSVGRQDSFFEALQAQLAALNTPVTIVPVIFFDTGPANSALLNISRTLNTPPQNAQLYLSDDLTVETVPSQLGQQVDIAAGRELIRKAILLRRDTPIDLIVNTASPPIIDAEPLKSRLETALSRPLTFAFKERLRTMPPDILAGMILIGQEFNDSDGTGQITATLNQAALAAYFYDMAATIDQPVKESWFHLDVETWTLIPIVTGQPGYALDVPASITMMLNWLQNPESHQLALPVTVTPPAVSAENSDALGINELIISSTTYFKGSSEERIQNIEVAASKFHGLVIPPGEVFSFNQYVGDIIAENGFTDSLIIQGDRTAVGIGGGVCQVSTTAYRAALYGGFEIVERWAHGYRVGWYEAGSVPGLDATIYSPTVDFKFKNDTNTYILIQTNTDLASGTVTFNFYGTNPGRTVTISDPIESNKVPHGPDIYQEDPDLKPNQIQQVDWASDGVDITIYRTVSEGDTVIHKDTIFSRYRPWQNVFKIGPD